MVEPKTILEFVKKNEVKILDLRFTDLPGLQHHVSYPIGQLSEAAFDEGFGMDGSSIRGWAAIHESDMLLMPDSEELCARSFYRGADARDDMAMWSIRSPSSAMIAIHAISPGRPKCILSFTGLGRHSLFRSGSGVFHLRQCTF